MELCVELQLLAEKWKFLLAGLIFQVLRVDALCLFSPRSSSKEGAWSF